MNAIEQKAMFEAAVVVSPAFEDGQPKHQDRAAWYPATRVAALADGVTTSPYSEKAAAILVESAPMLFLGDTAERLGALCDLLVAGRLDALQAPVKISAPLPAFRKLIADAARSKLADAFQSTFVSVCLTPADSTTSTEIIACGDSMFAAFDPSGIPLLIMPNSSRTGTADIQGPREFGPGDGYLVEILGTAAGDEKICRTAGINAAHAANWYLCRPIELSVRKMEMPSLNHRPSRNVPDGAIFVVPKHLIGTPFSRRQTEYCVLHFSEIIRIVIPSIAPPPCMSFHSKTAATSVLLDHYPAGRWNHWKEQFPADAHFLLASDGFYSAFDDATAMGRWLIENSDALCDESRQRDLVGELHPELQRRTGDDDISLVWLRPRSHSLIESG